jgi:archaeosine-15-forming tRNA-guanine transglycosylase
MPVSKSEPNLDINRPKGLVIEKILQVLEYQFGKPVFKEILIDYNNIEIEYSKKTGKIKYIFYDGKRLLSYKPRVGMFSLSESSAHFLHKNSKKPDFRVSVLSEIEEYIREGKSVFSKHVLEIDKNLRIGNEVIVVNETDDLIGFGKLMIPSLLYSGKPTGVAVSVRKGVKSDPTIKIPKKFN